VNFHSEFYSVLPRASDVGCQHNLSSQKTKEKNDKILQKMHFLKENFEKFAQMSRRQSTKLIYELYDFFCKLIKFC